VEDLILGAVGSILSVPQDMEPRTLCADDRAVAICGACAVREGCGRAPRATARLRRVEDTRVTAGAAVVRLPDKMGRPAAIDSYRRGAAVTSEGELDRIGPGTARCSRCGEDAPLIGLPPDEGQAAVAADSQVRTVGVEGVVARHPLCCCPAPIGEAARIVDGGLAARGGGREGEVQCGP
jgi:hypothetical protein